MIAFDLVDVTDSDVSYGILIFDNDSLKVSTIQNRISEIKESLECEECDWVIDDLINKLPVEWGAFLHYPVKKIIV